ncbi:hypothetical protein F5Y00DRAFT_259243 [Daldinia vernicosa]|uniref:uncharacterized protein n=1 Tax=Daldinia vernicosa TaxID=114800 RepID=UPI002008C61D|nr:uncharacterized protein F5Y00DRAFT_259243 [Daldinia vernicosa]KAI0851753.1 hypothetical protein F5Y00DRAFT_259243 [Daldinia vernicosa]
MDSILDPKLVEPTIRHSVDPRQASISHELVINRKVASNSPDMFPPKVPITFTYKRKDTDPPIYIAGSFSEPPWQPQEMDVAIDQLGGYLFTKQVMVDDGTEIQYKFRIGSGDWWALDESADTVTDESGNTNNILRVSIDATQENVTEVPNPKANESEGLETNSGTETPDFAQTADEVSGSARTLDPETPEPEISDGEAGRIGTRRMSTTPIGEVSETAAEVANVAATLDNDESALDDVDEGQKNLCPIFSHESVGPSFHKEDISDNDGIIKDNKSHSESGNPAIEIEDQDLDFDDPHLEEFPSDNRESIMAAMRRISTSIDADRTIVDEVPQSPVITILQNRKNAESLDNQGELLSDVKQNLRPSNSNRRSHSGRRASSSNSLGSIFEDDEARNGHATGEMEDATAPFVQHPGPSWGSPTPDRVVSDDEKDEGIAMRVDSRKLAEQSQQCPPSLPSPPASSDGNIPEAAELVPDKTASVLEDPVPEDNADVSGSNDDVPAVVESDLPKPSTTITARRTPDRCLSDSSSVESTSEAGGKSTSLGTTSPPGLRKRIIDRPATPPSTHHFQGRNKYPDWLEACIRIVFVKWIGGLASWLHDRRNKALMAAGTAAIVVGVGLLWQNPVRL